MANNKSHGGKNQVAVEKAKDFKGTMKKLIKMNLQEHLKTNHIVI